MFQIIDVFKATFTHVFNYFRTNAFIMFLNAFRKCFYLHVDDNCDWSPAIVMW